MLFSWNLIVSLFIFISVFFSTIVFIDWIIIFIRWQSRIFIGRFIDQTEWRDKIFNIGLKWLRNPPKVRLTDSPRLVIIDIIKGNWSQSVQYW